MSSSSLGLLTGLGALGLYSYSMYALSTFNIRDEFRDVFPMELRSYSLFMFLTVQCLLIQIINAFLHVVAAFVKPLRGVRDLVFTTLAFPVGSIVVYTFWAVWFVIGREKIFPQKLDEVYPPWLNHATHTVIVPINMLFAVALNHKYFRGGILVTMTHMLAYLIFLHVVKARTGVFIYPYLDTLGETERMVYFALTGLFAYSMYRFGKLIRDRVYGSRRAAAAKKPASKGQKQR